MKIFLLFLLIIPFTLSAQKKQWYQFDSTTKKVKYEIVVEMKNVSKEELFERAKLWLSKYFNNSSAVIKSEDKEDGSIIGNGIVSSYYYEAIIIEKSKRKKDTLVSPMKKERVRFHIAIYLKDNKYKLLLTDFSKRAFNSSGLLQTM